MGDERGYAYPGQWYDEIENAPRPHECVECSDAAPDIYPAAGGWLCINCAISRAVDFLQQRVDSSGRSADGRPRIEKLVQQLLFNRFKNEVEKVTNAATSEVRTALKAKQEEILAAEKARIRDAIAKQKGGLTT